MISVAFDANDKANDSEQVENPSVQVVALAPESAKEMMKTLFAQ